MTTYPYIVQRYFSVLDEWRDEFRTETLEGAHYYVERRHQRGDSARRRIMEGHSPLTMAEVWSSDSGVVGGLPI